MEQDGVVSTIEHRALSPEEIGLLASLITDEADHYTVLGVDRDATREQIEAAYCLAVEYFHPLKSRKVTESDSVMHWKLSSAFLRIEEAFAVLTSKSRRRVYDDELTGVTNRSFPPSLRHPSSDRSMQSEWSHNDQVPGAREPGAKEMRRVERVPLNLPLRVSFDRYWQELTETLDVSPLGIRFCLSRPVEPGSQLRLELPMPRHLRTHSYDEEVYVVSAFVLYAGNQGSSRQVVAEFI